MRIVCLILVLALGACAPKPRLEVPKTAAQPGIYTVSGEVVSEQALLDALTSARVVLIGESHDNAADHAVQLRLLRGVADRKPAALGMEMFQRPFQPALDLYVAGGLDEDEMLEQTEYKERWGFDVDLYRLLWTFAQDRGIPIVALNARRELTKRIAKVGVDGLSEAERADLPELDLSDERYLAWIDEVFKSHGAAFDAQKLERFFAAQVAWDETMADTAARWSASNPEATLVVAAGRGHIERDWGIPQRLRRRLGAQYGDGAVISVVPVDADKVPRWTWATRERFADYVWVKAP